MPALAASIHIRKIERGKNEVARIALKQSKSLSEQCHMGNSALSTRTVPAAATAAEAAVPAGSAPVRAVPGGAAFASAAAATSAMLQSLLHSSGK